MKYNVKELLKFYENYRTNRLYLLKKIEIPDSCRDPLSEFSEVLVATILKATPAKSRVQKGYDLETAEGEKIEVKYLSNPKKWINWHKIILNNIWDKYALVYYEELSPKGVFIFPKQGLEKICRALGKRHGKTDRELQFTKNNYRDLSENPDKFRKLGVQIFLF